MQGRGREDGHYRKPRTSDSPTVGLDYCFPSLAEAILIVLVITEIYTGAVEAVLVPDKGPIDYAVKCVVKAIAAWGFARVALASDQEPAIIALANAVQAARTHETVLYQGPRYDSQS